MKTKRIEWSHPTSLNACKFGFERKGCYTVEIVYLRKVVALGGYATFAEAWNVAKSRPEAWDRLTRK